MPRATRHKQRVQDGVGGDEGEQDKPVETSPVQQVNASSPVNSPEVDLALSSPQPQSVTTPSLPVQSSPTQATSRVRKRRRTDTEKPLTPLSASLARSGPIPLINAYWVQHNCKWPEALTTQIRKFMLDNNFTGYEPGNPVSIEAYDRLHPIVRSQVDEKDWGQTDNLKLHKKLKAKLEDIAREVEFIKLSGQRSKDDSFVSKSSKEDKETTDRGISGCSEVDQNQTSAFSAASYESIILHLPFLTPTDLSRVVVEAQRLVTQIKQDF